MKCKKLLSVLLIALTLFEVVSLAMPAIVSAATNEHAI